MLDYCWVVPVALKQLLFYDLLDVVHYLFFTFRRSIDVASNMILFLFLRRHNIHCLSLCRFLKNLNALRQRCTLSPYSC